jgi:hypothetical protein
MKAWLAKMARIFPLIAVFRSAAAYIIGTLTLERQQARGKFQTTLTGQGPL